MFVIIGALLGAVSGGVIAAKRKGSRADILQYALVYCMLFAVVGLFATLIIHRFSI